MPQTFRTQTELAVKLALIGLFLAVGAAVALLVWRMRFDERVGDALAQPIPFSHKHHVGDDGLDCRFCHATVETAAFPGMPSATVCLTCHSQLFADQPVFEPLRRAVATGTAIAWQHANELPDYAYFDHSVHVTHGVACLECHGRLDQQPLVWRNQALHMRWCVSCHENPAPRLRPLADVFRMDADRPSAAEAEALAALLKIEPRERLTDCSTCHR